LLVKLVRGKQSLYVLNDGLFDNLGSVTVGNVIVILESKYFTTVG